MSKIVRIRETTQAVTNERLWEAGIDRQIRMVELKDISELLHLEQTCFDPKFYSSLLTQSAIRHLIGRGNGIILLHKQEDRLTGYAQIVFRRNFSAGRLYSLAVHPDFQGKSVAKLLFKSVEQTCKVLGANTVLLEIREDNQSQRHCYEKLSYLPYRRVTDYYPDGCAAIKMKRKID
jgi:ribosomal protein S18 acetylase RimI-like enzyme